MIRQLEDFTRQLHKITVTVKDKSPQWGKSRFNILTMVCGANSVTCTNELNINTSNLMFEKTQKTSLLQPVLLQQWDFVAIR